MSDDELRNHYETLKKGREGPDQVWLVSHMLETEAAAADYHRWGRRPSWHPDEAVALTLGKDPSLVTWDLVESYVGSGHPCAEEYAELRENVRRAEAVGDLTFPVKPDRFLSWLKQNNIGYPPELEASLGTRTDGVDRSDEPDEGLKAKINALKQENDALQLRITELEEELRDNPPGSTTARNSLLKIVLGIAMARYGHNPRASRTGTAIAIQRDLDTVGIDLSDDTIRHWLQEAGNEVSPDIPSEYD